MPEEPTIDKLVLRLANDQQRRWRDGDRITVAAYFAHYPVLLETEECAGMLIANELRLREEVGDKPDFEAYVREFPQLADYLRLEVGLVTYLLTKSQLI